MASARASEALNKGSRRVLLWVAEPSSQNILATGDLAKDVALEHLTVDDMNAVLSGFQGTATVQNVCVVVRHENSAVLVRTDEFALDRFARDLAYRISPRHHTNVQDINFVLC